MGNPDNEQRFTLVYEENFNKIFRYTARRVPAHLVEDVLSEVFMLFYCKIDKVTPGAELPWLYRSCYFLIANLYRKEKDIFTEVYNSPSAESEVIANNSLLNALSSLTLDEREILFLVVYEAFEYDEIAAIMGISRNTAIKRFSRAKERFLEFYN